MHFAEHASSSSLPATAASLAPVIRACARHADVVGPRFCTSCGASLCTACARSTAHRRCPACRAAEGQASSVVDLAWYVNLLVDAGAHAGSATVRRALPLVASLAIASTIALVALFSLGAASAEEAQDAALGGALLAASFVWMLAFLLQPAIALPATRPVSFARRGLRAATTALVAAMVGAALCGAALAPGVLVIAVDEVVGGGLVLAGAFAASGLAAVFLLPLVPPAQAAAALGRASPLSALGWSFRGGIGTALLFCAAHLVVGLAAYSFVAPFVILAAIPFVAGPLVGGASVVAVGTAALVALLWLEGVYAVGSMRYADDAARARA